MQATLFGGLLLGGPACGSDETPRRRSGSRLVPSLKHGTVYHVPLGADGITVGGEVAPLFKTTNRYRDIAVNPNGSTFYVITDAQGSTASVDGGATDALENKGSVLEFNAD